MPLGKVGIRSPEALDEQLQWRSTSRVDAYFQQVRGGTKATTGQCWIDCTVTAQSLHSHFTVTA